jgi:hypothetical protein
MGLTVSAVHLSCEDSYDCGYITFMQFRINLAAKYNEEFGLLYKKWALDTMSKDECKRMNELCNEDLDIFLTHCDCDGKFTPTECKKIYNVIKDYQMDMQGHNYGIMKPYNMLEQWKGIFKHCYKNRVNLYFS